MHITQLPSEVMVKIFKELPLDSLKECSLVCKSLSVEAARICYYDIVLSNNHRSFLDIINHINQRIGDHVRVLTFSFESRFSAYRLDQKDFEKLISSLPQLLSIQFDFTSRISTYLKYLILTPIALLSNIQSINIPSSSIMSPLIFNEYTIVAYRLRNTITTLVLDNFRVLCFENNCSKVLWFLSEFVNLKSLSIINNTRTGAKGINMVSVLGVCPRLTHFEFTSEFSDMNEVTVIGKPKKNTNLEVLKLNVQDLTESNIDYLLHHLSTSLKLFHVQTGSKGLGQWLESTNHDRFIDLIRNVRTIRIHMADNVPGDRSLDLSSSWSFIHQLYHNRLVYKLKVLLSETTRCFHIIDLKQPQKLLEVQLCIPFSCLNQIDASFVNTISITNFSDTMSFEIGPTLINIGKRELWSIQLYDGQRSLSVVPFDKKRSLQLYRSLTISGGHVPIDKMLIVTFSNYNVDRPILNTIASIYPKTKKIMFSKCTFFDCETLGKNKRQYNIDLKEFVNLEELHIDIDITRLVNVYSVLEQFFVQITYPFGSKVYYMCAVKEGHSPDRSYYLDQCQPSIVEDAENTFIMAIQCSDIEEIILKTKNRENETVMYRVELPYPQELASQRPSLISNK